MMVHILLQTTYTPADITCTSAGITCTLAGTTCTLAGTTCTPAGMTRRSTSPAAAASPAVEMLGTDTAATM